MPITKIYKVKSTPGQSIDYGATDKTHKVLNKDDARDSLNYIMQNKNGLIYELSNGYMEMMKPYLIKKDDQIIFKTISTGVNCSVENADKEFKHVRRTMNEKNGERGVLQYCVIQNFGGAVDPRVANEIGVRFANEYLRGHQAVVSTHIDTGLVHNHIEFNAVNFLTGKKFNDNRKIIGEIRKVSDRLCDEYGIAVLNETREAKFSKWTDKNGKTHFFEPTNRKIETIKNRNEGKAAGYGVNNFTNTEQFDFYESNKINNAVTICRDIDEALPYVKSFDELTEKLRGMGYQVRDKKRDGSYMAHISYKAPEHERAAREDKLGEGYTREALTKKIDERIKTRNAELENFDEALTYKNEADERGGEARYADYEASYADADERTEDGFADGETYYIYEEKIIPAAERETKHKTGVRTGGGGERADETQYINERTESGFAGGETYYTNKENIANALNESGAAAEKRGGETIKPVTAHITDEQIHKTVLAFKVKYAKTVVCERELILTWRGAAVSSVVSDMLNRYREWAKAEGIINYASYEANRPHGEDKAVLPPQTGQTRTGRFAKQTPPFNKAETERERKRRAYLKQCIAEDIALLRYIEKNGVSSFEQMAFKARSSGNDFYVNAFKRVTGDNNFKKGGYENKADKTTNANAAASAGGRDLPGADENCSYDNDYSNDSDYPDYPDDERS